jgi:hypothetical protein
MGTLKQQSNEEKLAYLMLVLNENAQSNKKILALYYTISIIRFGGKLAVASREPSSKDINEQIKKYSSENFKPDYLVVELFSSKSRNVKPLAIFKFDYKNR